MKLSVIRLDSQGRYETAIVRDDGVRYRLRGHDCASTMPHDVAHYVVEKALGLDKGFWGRVASGGVFSSMSYVSGRRKPKAAELSKAVLKVDPDRLSEAEVLVRIFSETIQQGHDVTAPVLSHRLKDRRLPPGCRSDINAADIASVFSDYRKLRARWSDLPVGGSLELSW